MAENSKIGWATHTFNPWMGCSKVHTGCENCYAENLMDTRYGKARWGPSGTRVLTSDSNWKQPVKWNRDIGQQNARRSSTSSAASRPNSEQATTRSKRPLRAKGGC